jgi:hypothetical protein
MATAALIWLYDNRAIDRKRAWNGLLQVCVPPRAADDGGFFRWPERAMDCNVAWSFISVHRLLWLPVIVSRTYKPQSAVSRRTASSGHRTGNGPRSRFKSSRFMISSIRRSVGLSIACSGLKTGCLGWSLTPYLLRRMSLLAHRRCARRSRRYGSYGGYYGPMWF